VVVDRSNSDEIRRWGRSNPRLAHASSRAGPRAIRTRPTLTTCGSQAIPVSASRRVTSSADPADSPRLAA
jgi:hypothetical protein